MRENAKKDLTEELLDRFLYFLSPDREEAGQKYEFLRRRLITYFNVRGATDPDHLADETINRVIYRISEDADIKDISRYAHAVAINLWKESLRNLIRVSSLDDVDHPQESLIVMSGEPEDDSLERRSDALQKALNAFAEEDRKLLLAYYKDEGRSKIDHRRALAKSLDITHSTLRNRIFRLRAKLRLLVEQYLSHQA
jgi:DNA-directed RNA polymerase specialized sigma24 family protein